MLLKNKLNVSKQLDISFFDIRVECEHGQFEINNGINFCLSGHNPKAKRCEIAFRNIRGDATINHIKYDFKINDQFQEDNNIFIMSQIHALPDKQEPWRCPPFSFDIANLELSIYNRWDKNPITKDPRSTCAEPPSTIQSRDILKNTKLTPDKWHNITFDVSFSHKDTGFQSIKLNGSGSDPFIGPNTYNDQRLPYLKLGLYRPQNFKQNSKEYCIAFRNISISYSDR